MRNVVALFLFCALGLLLAACIGSRSDLFDDTLEAGAQDASMDRDAGRDARADTGPDVQYVPKAKRCARDGGPPDPFVFDGGGFDASGEGGDIGMPQAANSGGPLLRMPVFIPITFKEDLDGTADELEDFIASIGCTEYWDQVARDYGVGIGVTGPPVRVPEAAWTKVDDSQLAIWLRNRITAAADGGAPFPQPTDDTLYVIFLPESTTVTLQGSQSCVSFGAYHYNTSLIGGRKIAYAIVPRCSGFGGGVDAVTGPAAHELIEAVTDPYPSLAPAHTRTDSAHLAWSLFAGGEVADLCEFNSGEFFTPNNYPWSVARSWSNKEASLEHDPCLTAEGDPWAIALPGQPDVIHYFTNNPLRGIKLAINASTTVPLRIAGTGTGPVTIDAVDGASLYGGQKRLNLSVTPNNANIGETVTLNINKVANGQGGVELFMLRTHIAGREVIS
jgi:hypothetical protein